MPTETLSAITPPEILLQIGGEYALSRCLHVVADLGVADALDDQPRTAAALAESTATNADALTPRPAAAFLPWNIRKQERQICPH